MKTKRLSIKQILITLIAAVIIIQFIPVDKTNPETVKGNDIISMTNADKEISEILKRSCYDCHSNDTKYPWYSKIAPVSWYLKAHIKEGREHFNFSEWKSYDYEKQVKISQESIEEVKDNEMPLKSYTLIHSEAKLSADKKEKITRWFTAEFKINFDTEQ